MSFSPADTAAMRRALELAAGGVGLVEPNPPVGCVIADAAGRVLGEGFHAKLGGPHAEAAALAAAFATGQPVAGGTAYITLEPCADFPGKRTPPCVDALLAAGLARVVVACADPHPAMRGQSLARLRSAGVRVETGLLEAEAAALLAPYAKRVRSGRPWVILKWAQSLDGFTADADERSQWISGPESRRKVHELRALCDALMVGVGTALADDPQLTAREVEVRRSARRVVVDPSLRLPTSARLLTDGGPPVLLACSAAAAASPRAGELQRGGHEVLGLPARADGALDLGTLLDHLGRTHQATRVLVEGGATLAGHLLRQELVDECRIHMAPILLGAGRPAVIGWQTPLSAAHGHWRMAWERCGDDLHGLLTRP